MGLIIFIFGLKLEGKGFIWFGDLEVEIIVEMYVVMDLLDSMDVDFIKIIDSVLMFEFYFKVVKEVKKWGY